MVRKIRDIFLLAAATTVLVYGGVLWAHGDVTVINDGVEQMPGGTVDGDITVTGDVYATNYYSGTARLYEGATSGEWVLTDKLGVGVVNPNFEIEVDDAIRLNGIDPQIYWLDGAVNLGSIGTSATAMGGTGTNLGIHGATGTMYLGVSAADYLVMTVATTQLKNALAILPTDLTGMQAPSSITATTSLVRVASNSGSVSLTATPTVEAGSTDGQLLTIQGTSDSLLITIQDQDNLASSGLALSGNVDFTFGIGDTLKLQYDSGDSMWYEISRSNN